MNAERSFRGARDSVPAARHFVLEALSDVPAPTSDALGLMVSELATNCVLHATSGFHVAVQRTASTIRVDVTDSGGGQAQLQSPDATETHGRGLLIVQALSSEWGVTTTAENTGKTVWFCVTAETAEDAAAGETTAGQAATHQPVLQSHRNNTRARDEKSSNSDESTTATSNARSAQAVAVGPAAFRTAPGGRPLKKHPRRDVVHLIRPPGRQPNQPSAKPRVQLRPAWTMLLDAGHPACVRAALVRLRGQ